MELKVIIGQRLKEVRQKSHLSQYDIANELNIAQATIAQYERGRTCAPAELLNWYHNRFNVSFDYLFGYKTNNLTELLNSGADPDKTKEYIISVIEEYNQAKKK